MKNSSVLILGMHRSGTSCLAGSLEVAGLHLGDVVTEAPFNKKGNRENKTAMQLHEDVLTHSGGAWNNPPTNVQWSDTHLQRLDDLILSYPESIAWGIKDPRMLLVIDEWIKRLSYPKLVGTLRHPVAVVRSLRSRHKDYQDDSLLFDLWFSYNQKLLDKWNTSAFPIINFNCTGETYLKQITQVSDYLQLPNSTPSGNGFFDDTLRHQSGLDGVMPAKIKVLYEKLLNATLA